MKILVVDDSKAMRMIVMRNIRQAGLGDASIVEAGNGSEALDVVAGEEPDLILSDWNMPVMNGLELLEALRSRGSQTTFGFVTSEWTAEMREKAITAGASFLLAKPFTPDKFSEVISGVI